VLLYFLSSLLFRPYAQFKLNVSLIRDLGYTYTPDDGKFKMTDAEGIELMAKQLGGGTESARIRAQMIFEETKFQEEILNRIPIEELTYCQYLTSMIFPCDSKNNRMVRIYERAVDRIYGQELDILELIEQKNRATAITESILNKP
jgi:hypothetical protein